MQLLNYLYFIIITFLGFRFLYGSGIVVRHPLDRSQQMKLNGPESLWLLTFSTGLLAFSANAFVIDLMAIRLLVLEILCILGIFRLRSQHSAKSTNQPVFSAAMWVYALYLTWIAIGCLYTSSITHGIRTVLKYLYPFLLCLFASAAVRDGEVFIKAGQGAVLVGIIYLAFAFIPYMNFLVPGVFWYGTAAAINFISLMIFCLTLFFFSDAKKKHLTLTLLFLLPCFLWVFRTSIMGSIVALSSFFFIKYRFKSLPILLAIGLAGVLAVFTIPSLRSKMFKKNQQVTLEQFREGNVTLENVESNARFSMWENAEKLFYKKHPILGAGTGNLQRYMYEDFGKQNEREIVHSDFIQQKCDNGLIGLILYASIAVFVFLHCFIVYHFNNDTVIKMCAITAGSTILGVVATCYSDNTVNYSMATLSMPFGFYGMMLGLLQKQKEQG